MDAAHAADAVRILQDVSRWLIERGIGHWSVDEFHIGDFAASADAGELVMGFEDNETAAVMLLQDADALHWPAAEPGSALYIHKLAVRRISAGRRWSRRLFDWAENEARARGIPRLRLDTVPAPAMQGLRGLYESQGFTVVDPAPIEVNARTLIRMERALR